MRILFVRSSNNGIDPISTRQGESISNLGHTIDFFDIKGKGIIGYLYNVKALRKKVDLYGPDIIHAHYGMSGFLCVMAKLKAPIGISFMGSDILRTNRLFLILQRFLCQKFYAFVIVKSTEMYNSLNFKDAIALPNGVDLKQFKPINQLEAKKILNWDLDKKYILFPGDPENYVKNFPLALEIYNKLKEIGQQKIELISLNDIEFNKVQYYYNASDLVIFTSHSEGSPNVIKEAMACNCPIATVNVGDVKNLLLESKDSLVFETDKNEVYLNEILNLLNRNSRSTDRELISYLSSEKIAKKLIQIYNSVL